LTEPVTLARFLLFSISAVAVSGDRSLAERCQDPAERALDRLGSPRERNCRY